MSVAIFLCVAQMTGRKGRVVQTEDGVQYESRSEVDVPLETLNLTGQPSYCMQYMLQVHLCHCIELASASVVISVDLKSGDSLHNTGGIWPEKKQCYWVP